MNKLKVREVVSQGKVSGKPLKLSDALKKHTSIIASIIAEDPEHTLMVSTINTPEGIFTTVFYERDETDLEYAHRLNEGRSSYEYR